MRLMGRGGCIKVEEGARRDVKALGAHTQVDRLRERVFAAFWRVEKMGWRENECMQFI